MTRPVPRWIGALAIAGGLLMAVPLLGLLLRVPWSHVPGLLTGSAAQDALALSLRTCLASTVLCLVLGLPVALVLSRLRGRWVTVGRVIATVPMVLPPVVAGLALLVTFGRRGLVGQVLSVAGIEIGFTTLAVVISQTFVAMPFLVVAVEGALRSIDPDAELVAATLGAGPSRVLWQVTVPALRPAIVSGASLSAARALGEFGATITFAGSLQGTTRTLPLEIYLQREVDTDTALALAAVLIVLAAALVLVTTLVNRERTA
ncbi:MAG: ABC transporter permease [Micropruina sp.]|uniref:ABC transporter permease n=1 Tax=Micropruina sp. TaxID=2737536 RepID=UPI0039E44709